MFKFKAQGYYSWVVLNEKDKVVSYAPTKRPNLILNQGLNGIAVRSWADSFVACAVGTGVGAPAVTQTGLINEVRRTAVYLDLVDANSTSLDANVFTLRRTFVFPKEGSAVTYKEAGFSYSTTGPDALFSRVSLPNVAVSSGERLIVQYELLLVITPESTLAMVNPVSGGASSGVFSYQYVGLKGVNSLGQTYDYDAAESCNEPSTAAKSFLSTDSTAPAAFGSSVARVGTTFEVDSSLSTYVPDSFTIDKILTATKKQAVSGAWRSAGLGATSGSSNSNTGLVYVFNSNFQKPQGLLTLNFTFIWLATPTGSAYDTLFYWQGEENMVLKRHNPLLSYWNLNDE